MEADQILAFRLARSGLAERRDDIVDGVACPASDFSRDAALLAIAARVEGVTRDEYDAAVEAGDVVVGHSIRGAIHALAAADHALYGRALIATDDDELTLQLGEQVGRERAARGFSTGEALAEVALATQDALAQGRRLGKNDLHDALRERVRAELMPWCEGCKSHHVMPMLWRYATVAAGVRLDPERRYMLGGPGRAPKAAEAVRRFLHFYGPATANDFATWAGVARPHAQRLWAEVEGELEQVGKEWLVRADEAALASPPSAHGVRLIPPGDPFLQPANRPLLTPDPATRKRLFRAVSSPGAVLRDGKLAGLWRVKAKGRKAEVTIEPLTRLRRADVQDEAERIAILRGADLALEIA